MEKIAPDTTRAKIVPLARKKLLAQALFKDSPSKASIKQRKFTQHSVNTSFSKKENISKADGFYSMTVSPLRNKDINKEDALLKCQVIHKNDKNLNGIHSNNGLQEILIKLWKCSKMNLELDNMLKFEIERNYFSFKFQDEHPKLINFLTELNVYLQNHSSFPGHLFPYLEEIICSIELIFPLIHPTMIVFEAECLLSLAISRFSLKKIKAMRKIVRPGIEAKSISWAFLLIISEIDENLLANIKKFEERPWDLLIEYTSNPGQVVQQIRKFPECCRLGKLNKSNFYLGTLQKSESIVTKFKDDIFEEGLLELSQFLIELFAFHNILCKTITHENKNRFLRSQTPSDYSCNSERSSTPQKTITKVPKLALTNSNTNFFTDSSGQSNLQIPDASYIKVRKLRSSNSSSRVSPRRNNDNERKTQFLQESRFNKRIVDALIAEIAGKMKCEPDYLEELKIQDWEKYLSFKEEFIEIHKDAWVIESIKKIEKSELFDYNFYKETSDGKEEKVREEDLKLIEIKKAAFFSYVSNAQLVRQILEKAKQDSLEVRA
ncbi:hypothetical protein SteCoe_11270 [Stentor coeruleus]|uniref:Uncharacterized protein n=1 Tax=Stentor coeruleus TaxID=5963 RepID=A0A1R2B9V8_9CILI|nr:hypothetical protein SteCoe_27715 [Stentor coeruleus]OMJ87119.1 hypothetical protein SteCoe_11270 [Stentor coeruleus]